MEPRRDNFLHPALLGRHRKENVLNDSETELKTEHLAAGQGVLSLGGQLKAEPARRGIRENGFPRLEITEANRSEKSRRLQSDPKGQFQEDSSGLVLRGISTAVDLLHHGRAEYAMDDASPPGAGTTSREVEIYSRFIPADAVVPIPQPG